MSDLPEPLTPSECDLTDFQYMELDVRRLRDSKFSATPNSDAFRAGILLWCAAWHQIPAASLPNDDVELASLAGYGRMPFSVKEWKKVRAEALHGFIECSDGRLYHRVIAEKALAAHNAKEKHAYGKCLDRIRKENVKRTKEKQSLLGIPTFEQWKSGQFHDGIPQETNQHSSGIPVESKTNSLGIPAETPLRGNREGEGEGYIKPKHLSDQPTVIAQPEPVDNLHERNDSENQQIQENQESLPPKRNVEIAVLLRKQGVKPFSFAHPQAVEWGSNPAVTDDILTAAVQQARDYKPQGDISPNYLKPIVEQLLAPPTETKKRDPPDDWHRSDAGTDRKARELGIHPRPTESYADLRSRIWEEIRKGGGKAA